jgi:hypothetical protein
MKTMRIAFYFSALLFIAVSFNSCKKITEDQLINGLWQVTNVSIDNSTDNYLNTLPFYPNGNDCCAYKLDFERDNTVIAYYIANNNFNRIFAGNWEVTAYNEIYVQVDSFIDGTFKITQPSIKTRVLTSDANHIKAFDGTPTDTAETVITMKKI